MLYYFGKIGIQMKWIEAFMNVKYIITFVFFLN